ncbi:molybdopterin-dependent oxidoreductase [Adlercreutzia rubneri]
MKRVEGAERGAGEFERIAWDEAIDEIARRWKSYCDEFGSESIAVVSGSGNYHLASGVALGASGIQRFKTPSCSSLRAFWPAGTWRCIWPPTRRGSAGRWGEMCSALW